MRTDAPVCAAIACASAIGDRYGFKPDTLASTFLGVLDAGGEMFVAQQDARVVGFAWIDAHGAFSSAPYLRLIAVDESLRSSGVGSLLLDEFERRTASVGRDWCLLVSDFNERARAFYKRHGYREVGALTDFARPGITEIIMTKKRSATKA
jgi:ribosomal protein S18 acetylase RimI-like enzyme